MNKTTKWLVGLVAVLVLVNIALAASIWLKKDEAVVAPRGGDAREYLVKALAMNEAQAKGFDSLRRGHFERMRGYQEEMRHYKDALFDQLKSAGPSQVDSFAQRIGRLQATIDLETFNHFSQLRSLLTAQQQLTFDQTIQEVLHTLGPRGGGPPRRPGEGSFPNRPGGPPPPDGPPDGPPQ